MDNKTNMKYLKIFEDYEMDIENGDMGDEHAKAVIDRVMENNKKDNMWDVQKALDSVVRENDLDKDRTDMVIDSLQQILKKMTDQAPKLKYKK